MSKSVEKATVPLLGPSKTSLIKKSGKDIVKPVAKGRGRKPKHSSRSEDLGKLTTKSSPSKKHVGKPSTPKKCRSSPETKESKSSGTLRKVKDKKTDGIKKTGYVKKKGLKEVKTSKASLKTSIKSKQRCEVKKKAKSKVSHPKGNNQFIDIMSFKSMGKREASLNATVKVNIMYEKQSSPKKSLSTESSPAKSPSVSGKGKCSSKLDKANNESNKSSPTKRPHLGSDAKESPKTVKNGKTQKKSPDKNSKSVNKKTNEGNKRKNSYKIYEDEPVKKARKKEIEKNQVNKIKKTPKKKIKTSVLGHNLGNIIEKSPRQASLMAKAMIAMEQEEDLPIESAARTLVYDWTEVRSCGASESRKMVWVTGCGDLKSIAQLKKSRRNSSKTISLSMSDAVKASSLVTDEDSNSLHNSLLKTIHQMGDPRLLKEFFRSVKEDFQGDVDIEKCQTPEPSKEVQVEQATPSPKKKSTTHSPTKTKKPEKKMETVKPIVSSPVKNTPCRVATPIPQFPSGQRPSQMTSFISHPPTQTVYPNIEQHAKQQTPPQPIKVTPYAPSSAYVYQYSPERQGQNLFVPNTPSPMPFSADANDLVSRNYPATFTFNQMGGLSFERRGLNPYQSPSSAYNPSMHLPIQPVGFNFQQFYQPSLQQLHSQPNIPSMQPVPLSHHQYPLVPSVMQQPPLGTNLNAMRTFQSTFPQYPPPPSQDVIKQDKSCMPPPPPTAQSLPQVTPMTSIVQPLPSYRRAVPLTPQVQCTKIIKPSPERFRTVSSGTSHAFMSPSQSRQKFIKNYPNATIIHNPQPIRLPTGANVAFRPIMCKKETAMIKQTCDKADAPLNLETPKKAVGSRKVSSPTSEDSSMSAILHSAHLTMFPTEEKGANNESQQFKQNKVVAPSRVSQVTSVVLASSKPSDSCNGSFSVSSILEMPNYKVKSESKRKSCAFNTDQSCPSDLSNKGAKKETYFLCLPPQMINGKPGTTAAIPLKENVPLKVPETKNPEVVARHFPPTDKVIVIDDSEDSSDDEPLAKLIQTKSVQNPIMMLKIGDQPVQKIKTPQANAKTLNIKLGENKGIIKPPKSKPIKAKLKTKDSKDNKKSSKVLTPITAKQSKTKPKKDLDTTKLSLNVKAAKKDMVDQEATKVCPNDLLDEECCNNTDLVPKKTNPKLIKKVPVRRKSKTTTSVPPLLPKVKAIHGWSWVGDSEWRMIPKLTQQREESLRIRKCYKSMKHTFGETISVRDCVILQSDGDGNVPYVGKVSALWENLNGDMMFSMLWYYQPEHTAVGREPEDGEQELFASKHREENSVACIDDKCYVLMYNEFCRMEADAVRQELGVPAPCSHQMIPILREEDRKFLRPLPPIDICSENIWFCRYDYDIRKKIVRKPKHKKNDLRYRGPCKLVQ